jgi:hypothetical protein
VGGTNVSRGVENCWKAVFIPAAHGRRYMMKNGHTQYHGAFTSTVTEYEIFRKMKKYRQDRVSHFLIKMRICGLSPQNVLHYISRLNNSEIRTSDFKNEFIPHH